MTKVYSIHEAKTQLSKLVKEAEAGGTIYLGAYGEPEVVLVKAPSKTKLKIGIYSHKKIDNAYDMDDLIGSDEDIVKDFEDSINRPLP